MNKHNLVSFLLGSALLLFSLGQLARISIPDKPVFFYLYELLVSVLTGILLLKYRLRPLKDSRWKTVILFFGWLLLSFVISVWFYPFEQNIVAFLYYLRLLLYFLFFIYVNYYFHLNRTAPKPVFLLNATAIWIIGSSFVQYFLYQNLGNLSYLGWDPHLYRVVGLFFDPPITVSVFMLLALYYLLEIQRSHNWNYLSLIIPLLVLSFLTYSRGGLLGLLAVCILYVVKKRNWKVILVGVFLIIGGMILIPKGSSEGINLLRTTSIEARINDYEKGILIWKKNPLTGIGYNHIRYEKDIYEEQLFYGPYNPSHGSTAFHSSFLVILVTGGVVGLVLYLWMITRLARISEYMMYGIVFLSVVSVFDNVLLHPLILFLLFLLEGYRIEKTS